MSTSLDPLKETSQDLHRFWFIIKTEQQWYSIIRECRNWFGSKWIGQNKVRRKLAKINKFSTLEIWFEVPDAKFATWISVKYSIQVRSDSKKDIGK